MILYSPPTIKLLDKPELCTEAKTYFLCRLQHRHNEIWLRLVPEEDSGSQAEIDAAVKSVV